VAGANARAGWLRKTMLGQALMGLTPASGEALGFAELTFTGWARFPDGRADFASTGVCAPRPAVEHLGTRRMPLPTRPWPAGGTVRLSAPADMENPFMTVISRFLITRPIRYYETLVNLDPQKCPRRAQTVFVKPQP
jgi:hypothetical protein